MHIIGAALAPIIAVAPAISQGVRHVGLEPAFRGEILGKVHVETAQRKACGNPVGGDHSICRVGMIDCVRFSVSSGQGGLLLVLSKRDPTL